MRRPLPAPRRLACALAAASLCAAAAPRAELQLIALPAGSSGSSAFGLNDAGQVVGEVYDSAGYPRAFVWSAATGLTPLWADPAWYGSARAINAQGQVAGTRSTSPFDSQAFLWSPGSGLRVLGPGSAIAIDDAGRVGGGSAAGATIWLPDGTARALPGTNGVVLALDGSGGAVGISDNRASVWRADGTRTLIGNGTTGAAYGANPQGQVVGFFNAAEGSRPFVWDSAGGARELPRLSERGGSAAAINAGGQIVGQAQLADARSAGVLWREGAPAQQLLPLLGAGYNSVTPRAINAHAQIAGEASPQGSPQRAFLLTLHPDWSGGDGAWDDSTGQRWDWAGTGTAAARVGAMHDVVIDPGRSATVRGAAEVVARSLRIGGTGGTLVTLDLNGGSTRVGEVAGIEAGGVLRGNGRLEAGHIVVDAGGRLQVDAGQAMQLGASTVGNAGQLRVQGTAAQQARLEVTGKGLLNDKGATMQFVHADVQLDSGLDNAGQLSLQNAQLTLGAGKVLDNAETGQVAFGFGGSLVNGTVYNEGLLVVSNGAQASFYGDVDNAGELRVSAGGAADFFGRVVSAGEITGDGEVRFEGGLETKDPKLLQVRPDAWIASELALSAGQRIAFDGAVTLEGATLALGWADAARAGTVYDLFDWNGTLQGRFDTLALPTLGSGLAWDTSDLYAGGTVSIAAIPEPGTWMLMLAGMAAVGGLVRRAQG